MSTEKENDDLEIRVDDEAEKSAEKSKKEDGGTVISASNGEDDDEIAVDEPSKAIQQLKQQLASEKKAREDAERRAADAANAVHAAKNEVEENNLHLVKTAINDVKRENNSLKANYAAAMAAGDYEKAADLQLSMSSNSAKLLQLENGMAAMEERVKNPVRSDPVEDFAARLTPRSAAWVRAHPEFVTDQRLNQKMLAAHALAMADGCAPDSDEYFSSVEETLKLSRQPQRRAREEEDDENPLSEAAAPAKVRNSSPPPAAPPSRSASSNGARTSTITLTREQRQTASDLGMTDREYAKQLALLKQEGRLQ
jgi:hypothetical protein